MKIRRLLGLAAALCCCLPVLPARGEEALPPPEISAKSAVVLTADTGLVLCALDKDTPRPMASTTKIMTALLTLEEAARTGDRTVEITPEMTGAEGSSMGLNAGDRVSLSGLAAGMMMASGNDAAQAAALAIDGSLEQFARRMNDRAAALGMKHTCFVTPSGLDAPGHEASAYDMALLAREALENEAFAQLAAAPAWPVEFLGPEGRTVRYRNHNKLLAQVEGCIGVKTGYTDLAGRCLVSAAERDGVRLIAVTLNDPDDWKDHAALLEYGFSQVEQAAIAGPEGLSVPLADERQGQVPIQPARGMTLTLPRGMRDRLTTRVLLPRFLLGPVRTGETVGALLVLLDGEEVFRLPLRAADSLTARLPTG